MIQKVNSPIIPALQHVRKKSISWKYGKQEHASNYSGNQNKIPSESISDFFNEMFAALYKVWIWTTFNIDIIIANHNLL